MSTPIPFATQISIRNAGLNEYWLQEQIYNNPSCLGLGELEGLQRERRQNGGGRLDILLKDPEDDSMYEVEIMLGETDETHIIRTIEYWDNEKRRWPLRQHYAVIVAESINRRFFNVIHLLSNSIPIIAIQASLVESNGTRSLFFNTILNTYDEIDDGTSVEDKVYDKEYWNRRSRWSCDLSEILYQIANEKFKFPEIKYTKYYISISDGYAGKVWIHKRSDPKSLLSIKIPSVYHEEVTTLLESMDIDFTKKQNTFKITISKQQVETHRPAFEQLLSFVSSSTED